MAEDGLNGSQPTANARTGAYPNADRANLFGTLLLQFFAPGAPPEVAARAFQGLFALTWPKTRHDKEFKALYEQAKQDGEISDQERLVLVTEMVRVMDDLKTWDWQQTPEDDPPQVTTP